MRKCLPFLFVVGMLTGLMPARAQYYNQQANFMNANKFWMFGNKAVLDFRSGTPVADSAELSTLEGCASVSDPLTGELLFYTNGMTCWNRSHQVMPNGSGLLGNTSVSTTDGVCVVPMIDSPGKYYLFSMTGPTGAGGDPNGALYYSVVDMALEGGMGNIESGRKNIVLDTDTLMSEGMTAIPGNNCDIWLLVHAYVEPVFKAYHITREGVNHTPVVSEAGGQIHKTLGLMGSPAGSYLAGGMTVSPDRNLVAMTSFLPVCLMGSPDSLVGVLVCEFNPDDGTVSNAIEVGESLVAYNTAFSPDNKKLYMVNYDLFGGHYQLLQYDVSSFDSASIASSKIVIEPMVNTSEQGGYLRLYGDTIYVATYDSAGASGYISMITKPNLSGVAADFRFANLALIDSTSSNYVFPKEVVYPMDTAMVTRVRDTVICLGWEQEMSLRSWQSGPGFSYEWSDGSTTAELNIADSGTYWVAYSDGCRYWTDTFKVTGQDHDPIITIDVLTLSTIRTYATYQWMKDGVPIPGATGRRYEVEDNGQYQVIVGDGGPCLDTSDIYEVANLSVAEHPLKDQVSVYPNPTQEQVTINATFPVDVSLKDVTGKILWRQEDARSLSLSAWSDGIYFLQIQDQAGRTIKVEKIVKRK